MTKKIVKNNTDNKLNKLEEFEQKILGIKKKPVKKISIQSKILKTSKTSTREKGDKLTQNKFKPKPVKTEKVLEKKAEKKIEPSDCEKNKSKIKPKKKKPRRKLVFTVCNSKKSCGEHYGPYIWERVCNENNEDINIEEFEKNGITFKKSHVCQGRCKKASNVRIAEPAKDKTTQFSYMTPLKAVKLAKSLQSGAAPENIKKL